MGGSSDATADTHPAASPPRAAGCAGASACGPAAEGAACGAAGDEAEEGHGAGGRRARRGGSSTNDTERWRSPSLSADVGVSLQAPASSRRAAHDEDERRMPRAGCSVASYTRGGEGGMARTASGGWAVSEAGTEVAADGHGEDERGGGGVGGSTAVGECGSRNEGLRGRGRGAGAGAGAGGSGDGRCGMVRWADAEDGGWGRGLVREGEGFVGEGRW